MLLFLFLLIKLAVWLVIKILSARHRRLSTITVAWLDANKQLQPLSPEQQSRIGPAVNLMQRVRMHLLLPNSSTVRIMATIARDAFYAARTESRLPTAPPSEDQIRDFVRNNFPTIVLTEGVSRGAHTRTDRSSLVPGGPCMSISRQRFASGAPSSCDWYVSACPVMSTL